MLDNSKRPQNFGINSACRMLDSNEPNRLTPDTGGATMHGDAFFNRGRAMRPTQTGSDIRPHRRSIRDSSWMAWRSWHPPSPWRGETPQEAPPKDTPTWNLQKMFDGISNSGLHCVLHCKKHTHKSRAAQERERKRGEEDRDVEERGIPPGCSPLPSSGEEILDLAPGG